MQLEITGFSHVAIKVTEFARARRFYVDLLGMSVALEGEGWALVKVGDAFMGILGDDAETTPDDRFDPHRIGLDHVSFAVDSYELLDRIKRDLDTAGVPNDGVHDETELDAKSLVAYDPDGIAIEFYVIPR